MPVLAMAIDRGRGLRKQSRLECAVVVYRLLSMPSMQFLFHPGYRRTRLYGNFLLFCLMLILGTVPGARTLVGQFAPELVLHAGMYATLTLLLYTAGRAAPFLRSMGVLITIAIMAAIDEGLQGLLPYREASVRDWMIDVVAAFVMTSMLYLIEKRSAARV